MANSILGSNTPRSSSATPGGFNPSMLQQLTEFKRNYTGNPKQAVMQMLQQGKITNPQLQQAMQMAQQIQGMIK